MTDPLASAAHPIRSSEGEFIAVVWELTNQKPPPADDVDIVKEFAEATKLRLVDVNPAHPFPDVLATDGQTGKRVSIELTQIADPRRLRQRQREFALKTALYHSLAESRPFFRRVAFHLYLIDAGRMPNPRSRNGVRFVAEFARFLRWTPLSDIQDIRDGTAPSTILDLPLPGPSTVLGRYVNRFEVVAHSPELVPPPHPDDPYIMLNTERVITPDQMRVLLSSTIQNKIRGEAYSADILLIHTATDPEAIATPDGWRIDAFCREVVGSTQGVEAFREIWLFDRQKGRADRLRP